MNKYWPPKPRKKRGDSASQERIAEEENQEEYLEEAEEEEGENDPECEPGNDPAGQDGEYEGDDKGLEFVPDELIKGMGLDPRSPDPPASAYVPATSDAYMIAKPPSPKPPSPKIDATASRAERLAMLALLDLT